MEEEVYNHAEYFQDAYNARWCYWAEEGIEEASQSQEMLEWQKKPL